MGSVHLSAHQWYGLKLQPCLTDSLGPELQCQAHILAYVQACCNLIMTIGRTNRWTN